MEFMSNNKKLYVTPLTEICKGVLSEYIMDDEFPLAGSSTHHNLAPAFKW